MKKIIVSGIFKTLTMKKCILLILSIFVLIDSFGQKPDSIKYANGYLYYHDYGNGEPIILLSGGPGASWQQEEEVLGREPDSDAYLRSLGIK